jgi:hypothetical protein
MRLGRQFTQALPRRFCELNLPSLLDDTFSCILLQVGNPSTLCDALETTMSSSFAVDAQQASAQTISFHVSDASQFAKQLRAWLEAQPKLPSHLALLNGIARSVGYRNYQSLRAAHVAAQEAAAKTGATVDAAPAIDGFQYPTLPKSVQRALNHFDVKGRMLRFPTQLGIRQLALWGLWCRLPASRSLTERDVNEYVRQFHAFEDIATLRRELVNAKLLWRTRDGSEYRKQAVTPTDDAAQFLDALNRETRRHLRKA